MQAIGDGREQELQRILDGASRSVRGLTRMRRQPSVQSRITARSESAEVGGLAVWLVLKEGRAVCGECGRYSSTDGYTHGRVSPCLTRQPINNKTHPDEPKICPSASCPFVNSSDFDGLISSNSWSQVDPLAPVSASVSCNAGVRWALSFLILL